MACTYTSGVTLNCKDFPGGVKSIFLGHLSDFTSGVTVTAHEVTALPTATIYEWDLKNESTLFEQKPVVDQVNHTIYFEQTLTVPVNALVTGAGDATRLALLDSVMREQNVIFVQDQNDVIYMMGRINGAEVTDGSITTGQAMGDFNGYNLTFTAKEKFQAEVLSDYGTDPFDNFAGITPS